MNKKTESQIKTVSPRLLSAEELAVYLGVGKSSATTFGEGIGAKRKIYSRTLYDKEVVDRHFDNLMEAEGSIYESK